MDLVQKFTGLIVSRFQNINPEKEGAKINMPSDVKNEIKIITLPDAVFKLWDEFLVRHASGDLINPETLITYNLAQSFSPKSCSLKREFFKHLGHFTDEDLKIFVQHLLGTTPNRNLVYPKVSVNKPKMVVINHHTASDWVERRKRKKVIIKELEYVRPSLDFLKPDMNVRNLRWRVWKKEHRFSSATWDYLLSAPPAAYFTKRLTNEGIHKHADDFVEKFPDLPHMFKSFLRSKNRLQERGGGVQILGLDSVSMSIVTSTSTEFSGHRSLGFAIMDLREAPKHKEWQGGLPPVLPFLEKLKSMTNPSMKDPNVWLWITEPGVDDTTVVSFISEEYDGYDHVRSVYKPCKGERLYDVTTRTTAPDVILHFMFKKGDNMNSHWRDNVKKEYTAPNIPYYTDPTKNHEAKWRQFSSELRMEFYLDLLQEYAAPGENFVGIFTGVKCMLAAKVRPP
jgi:hypothetical protein